MKINMLWHSGNENDWKKALSLYYENPAVSRNMTLEKRIENLNPSDVEKMSVEEFYAFLYNEYFVWKYTAKNRLATTRTSLGKYKTEGMTSLGLIQKAIFYNFREDPDNTSIMLETAMKIKGLGTAGASGLLSVMFPEHYGTVDQFLVIALRNINDLPEHSIIERMNENQLKIKDGVLLEDILRRKAADLNRRFKTKEWTPRKIDMVLWSTDRG